MTVEDRFEALRPRLRRVAHGILGTLAEAEDVVQEAWLRLESADVASIRDLEGWLVTVVGRRALDVLRSARTRREVYPGTWLPEPVVGRWPPDPLDDLIAEESIRLAMLRVLETLSPAERGAFVLHDVFGLEFDAVAQTLDRSPAACRQLAVRARRHLREARPRFETDSARHAAVVTSFVEACRTRDPTPLLAVLDSDVTVFSDGGGEVSAARRPIRGAERVGRYLLGVLGKLPDHAEADWASVNGELGVVIRLGGQLCAVVGLVTGRGRVRELLVLLNPAKLARVRTEASI